MGCKEKEKLCKKGPLEGEREGGSNIHQCRVGREEFGHRDTGA